MITKTKKSTGVGDMCSGPLFSKIVLFFIPIMLSNLLQMLYNAADQAVLGQFASSDALGAVGSTSSLYSLLTCLVIGLSVGANALIARNYGAKDVDAVHRSVHTAIVISVISGFVIGIAGFFLARPLLIFMDTQPDVLDNAVLYMQILFVGTPLVSLYNFGSAILRATGDTKRPLYFLAFSGLLNVLLNLFFVIVFHMTVDGVALATVISQAFSVFLTLRWLSKIDDSCRLSFSKLRLYKRESLQIIAIGVPSALQSSMFSIANTIMQSSVNSISKAAVIGNTGAQTVESFVTTSLNALYHAALSFCAQNFGAKKYDRVLKSLLYCLGIVFVLGLSAGLVLYFFRDVLLHIFITDNDVAMAAGRERIAIIALSEWLCGAMDVSSGALRAINHSNWAMVNSVFCVCVLRIFWVMLVFPLSPSLATLYASYPLSWGLSLALNLGVFFFFFARMRRSENALPKIKPEN